MSLPYEHATSGDKALGELQRILGKFGCHRFGTMIDHQRGVTIPVAMARKCRWQVEVSV